MRHFRQGGIEFATVDGTVPTVLNVQSSQGESDSDAEERGWAVIADVVKTARLDPGEYEPRVVVADNVGQAVVEATS